MLVISRRGRASRPCLPILASNGARIIIVETASRFARDLMVQEAGFSKLKALGITLIAVDSAHSFLDDTPTSKLIRQILGAVSARGAAYGLPLCVRTYRVHSGAKLLGYRNLAVGSRNVLAKKTPAGLRRPGLSDVSAVGTIIRPAIVASRGLAIGKEKAPR